MKQDTRGEPAQKMIGVGLVVALAILGALPPRVALAQEAAPAIGEEERRASMRAFCGGFSERARGFEGDCAELGASLRAHIEANRETLDWVNARTDTLSQDPAWGEVLMSCVDGFLAVPASCQGHPAIHDAMQTLQGEPEAAEVAPERRAEHGELTQFCETFRGTVRQYSVDCAMLNGELSGLFNEHPELLTFIQGNPMERYPEEEQALWMEAVEPCVMGLVDISMSACEEDEALSETLDRLGTTPEF